MQVWGREISSVLSSILPLLSCSVSFAWGNWKSRSLNVRESGGHQSCASVNTGCCLSKATSNRGHSGKMEDLRCLYNTCSLSKAHCSNLTSSRYWRESGVVCHKCLWGTFHFVTSEREHHMVRGGSGFSLSKSNICLWALSKIDMTCILYACLPLIAYKLPDPEG